MEKTFARVNEPADDSFTLYDLKVEVVAGEKPMVCSHHPGDYFLVQGKTWCSRRARPFPCTRCRP